MRSFLLLKRLLVREPTYRGEKQSAGRGLSSPHILGTKLNALGDRDEDQTDGRRRLNHFVRGREFPSLQISCENDDIVRLLICHEQMLAAWIDGEVPRDRSASRHGLNYGRFPCGVVDGKNPMLLWPRLDAYRNRPDLSVSISAELLAPEKLAGKVET